MWIIDTGAYECSGDLINEPTLTLDDIVPHGRWIDSKRTSDSKCSVCKKWVVWTGVEFAYCPNCGAKMDGEDE